VSPRAANPRPIIAQVDSSGTVPVPPTTVLFNASAARANIVFDFSGECTSGCTGTATDVLTLADSYTFGTDLTLADFISFTYSSSARDFEILHFESPPEGLPIVGGLNANDSVNARGIFGIVPLPNIFPFFQVNADGFVAFTGVTRMDKGSTFSFRREITTTSPGGDTGAVPEPSTWAMMLLGFATLGLAGYRAKRKGRGSSGVSRAH
jgi:PEP-CTERM motif